MLPPLLFLLKAGKESQKLTAHVYARLLFPQEIYEDPRTIGHAVTKPEDTMAELRKLFNL